MSDAHAILMVRLSAYPLLPLSIIQAYAQSDERLGKLVSTHYNDLTTIVKVFSQVSSRITESKEKVRHVKDNLTQCKMLLQVRKLGYYSGVKSPT